AETEKYAHVTYFFNGGVETPYLGEERLLVPSQKVATYDLMPEMSAPGVTDVLCNAIEAGHHDFILCNYANGDMVGHSGVLSAAVKAVETVDQCLERVVKSAERRGATLLVTADHGNCELMPEMSAPGVTDVLCNAIEAGHHDFILCNYANGDMVGHSGVLSAAVKAVETVDQCLERVVKSAERRGATLLVTADHGNCELM